MTHINDNEMQKLLSGDIDFDESQKLLGHISNCEICSQRFSDCTLSMTAITPPEGIYEEVLNAAVKEKSDRCKKAEILFLYSMRVVTGVCAAIVLMYTGMFERIVDYDYDMTKINDASYSISEHLHDNLNKFSDTLFKMEVKA